MAASHSPRDNMSPGQILAQGFEEHGIPDLISDEDDDEVTRVMDVEAEADSSRSPTMIPPRVDDGDVYLLTRPHLRFKAGLVAPERVNLMDVMRAPSDLPPPRDSVSDRETLEDLCERDTTVRLEQPVARSTPPSLAPLAMDAPVTAPAPRRAPRRGAAVVTGALAITAAAALLIPRAHRVAAPQATDVQAAAQSTLAAEDSVFNGPVELAAVEIVGGVVPVTAAVAEQVRAAIAAPAAAPAPVPAVQEAKAESPSAALEATAAAAAPDPEPAELAAFDKNAANQTLAAANRRAASCREEGMPNFPYNIAVTFAPTGKVTSAVVQGAPYAGTSAGGCIARAFRSASVPAFSGALVTVHKVFELP